MTRYYTPRGTMNLLEKLELQRERSRESMRRLRIKKVTYSKEEK